MTDREAVEVTCRHGAYPGVRIGRVASYDFEIPAQHPVVDERERTQRVFLLLDEHIQLQQPRSFLGAYADWWYVDLVEIAEAGPSIVVADHWVDLVVPPFGQPYQLRDLDEFAVALSTGALTAKQAADGLARVQRFVDAHLHGPLVPEPRTDWFDFPPTAIEPLRRSS